MSYDEIRALLEAYWKAESTLEEERQLKAFFASAEADLPEDLEEAREWFLGVQASREVQLPQQVWPMEAAEPMGTRTHGGLQVIWSNYWEYAAILLLALGSYALFKPKPAAVVPERTLADTYKDPQQAYEVTKHALEMLSNNLNRAKAPISKLALLQEAESKIKAR